MICFLDIHECTQHHTADCVQCEDTQARLSSSAIVWVSGKVTKLAIVSGWSLQSHEVDWIIDLLSLQLALQLVVQPLLQPSRPSLRSR